MWLPQATPLCTSFCNCYGRRNCWNPSTSAWEIVQAAEEDPEIEGYNENESDADLEQENEEQRDEDGSDYLNLDWEEKTLVAKIASLNSVS